MLTNMRMPIQSNKAWNKITIRCTKHHIRVSKKWALDLNDNSETGC